MATTKQLTPRSQFIAIMRRPEMHILRLALLSLKYDHGIDWQTITSLNLDWHFLGDEPTSLHIDVEVSYTSDKFFLLLINPNDPNTHIDDFLLLWLHNPENPMCQCWYCWDDRKTRPATDGKSTKEAGILDEYCWMHQGDGQGGWTCEHPDHLPEQA